MGNRSFVVFSDFVYDYVRECIACFTKEDMHKALHNEKIDYIDDYNDNFQFLASVVLEASKDTLSEVEYEMFGKYILDTLYDAFESDTEECERLMGYYEEIIGVD